ncbi:MAG: hypothetical protein NC231_11430 [Bacillus sp. (in: Bacteria)]|nr:hypothetical protein [Bacillus sp. (in: firmicutes)]MCM1426268.1 hypothetical protein [Eubacterium sp.]
MLDLEKTQNMSDIIHTSIDYSGIENAIISTPIFNRLHRISQSSLVFLTFPSNKVKRFEHSVGTMYLAGEIFYNSLCNSTSEVLNSFAISIKHEIKAWRKNTKQSELPKDLRNKSIDDILNNSSCPQCSFYYKYCPSNIENGQRFSLLVMFQAIRIAGLLHDVGHLPYSHILETALKDLYQNAQKSTKIDKAVKDDFENTLSPFVNGKDEIHEEFGKLLVNSIEQCILDNLPTELEHEMTYFFLKLSFYFARKILSAQFADNNIFADIHLIIAGVVDADRLDYCTRDSVCAALDTDIFYFKRFLHGYTILQKSLEKGDYEHFFFSPSAKNLNMIEDLLNKRYKIYSCINFHHRVHKHEIILEKVISRLGLLELENMKSVDILPDVLPLEVSSIWKLVKEIKNDTKWLEYQLIQLDDSWLDTLLKHNFFKIYGQNYMSVHEHGNDVQWNQFDELISTTKRYCSLIKRSDDFRIIDEQYYLLFSGHEWKLAKLQETANAVKALKYADFLKEKRTFLFTYCINQLIEELTVPEAISAFYQLVEDQIKIQMKDEIIDCIIKSSSFGLGINTVKSPVVLTDKNNEGIFLEHLSSQRDVFLKEEAFRPPFHLYYLSQYDGDMPSTIDIMNLSKNLAQALIECLDTVNT